MRVAVVGATGAIGAAIVEALRFDPHKRVDAVVGISRQLPTDPQPHVEWKAVDVAVDPLEPHLQGVDALVNAAPRATAPTGHGADGAALARVVMEAAVASGVYHLVQVCSFLAYSPPASPGAAVDETWPTDGLEHGAAAVRAVALERYLNEFAAEHEVARMVRIRSGAVLGPRVRQQALARTGPFAGAAGLLARLPFVPAVGGSVPAVHHDDLAAAVRSAVTEPAFGAYNVALDEPLGALDVATALDARPVTVPRRAVRQGAALADRVARCLPHTTGRPLSEWMDIMDHALRLDTRRARSGLAWTPRHPLDQALRSTLETDRPAR